MTKSFPHSQEYYKMIEIMIDRKLLWLWLACLGIGLSTYVAVAAPGKGLNSLQNDVQSVEVSNRLMTRFVGQVPDSTCQKLDSVVEALARKRKCRITMKVTDAQGNSHYSGYDGRQEKAISYFGQPFEIGSCSKMLTATSILQLVEEKKIGLEDRLADLLENPELLKGIMVTDSADYLGEIQLKNLLNHTSGLPEYFLDDEDLEVGVHGDSTLRFTPDQLVRMARRLHKPQFPPGEKFKYTNTNYILLGMILEKHSGLPYQQYIRHNILEKAGMGKTYFPSVQPVSGQAPGHWKGQPSEMPATLAWSAGEIISTLDDMDRFIRAWARGDFYKSQETREMVRTQYFNPMGGGLSYGLGAINLFSSLGHGGQTFGFQSYMGSLPNGYSFVFGIDDAEVSSWGLALNVQGILRKYE